MAQENIFLTEAILTIQHEVQSALDYIDVVSREESTELGESSAFMALEKLRIRLPFTYSLEEETHYVEEERPPSREPSDIKQQLAARKGFPIDIGKPGGKARYIKVRFIPPQEVSAKGASVTGEVSLGEEAPQTLTGEIELHFAPLRRK
jgi:hypothetical protein